MNRVKTVVAVAAASALFLTAACGSGSSTGSGNPNGPYKLAFLQGVAGDPFYVTMQCAMQSEAQKLNAQVNTQGGQKFDPSLQMPILQSMISSRPDAILIAPTDVSAMQKPIEQATQQGIKVVLVDTTIKNPSVAASSVSSDNAGGGKAAFEAIKQLAPRGGKVLVVSTQPGVTTTDARTQGFQNAAKTDPAYTDLGVQYSQNEPQKAAQIVSAALQKDPDIVGIFATNLFSAEGAATGVRQANKQDQVKIAGFDAGPDQVKALQDGTVQALVAQQPATIGQDGLQQAVNALKSQPTTKNIQTGFTIITQANLNTPEGQAAVYKSSC
jgi:ribose transport system substrate-binding protein